MLESNDTEYEVLFFLDDNEKISNNRLYGKKIVFPGKSLRETLKGKQIDELIIAVQDISPDKKRWIIEECLLLSILVKEVPSVHKWVGGHLSAKQIKDVRIEDLLGRKQINVASTNAVKELGGKVVLVTGAAGSIGSEISRQIVKCGPLKLILLDQAESPLYDLMQDMQNEYGNLNFVEIVICDITDELLIERIFHKNRPDVVFHAAAYKHVPLMEDHPFEAVKTNVLGSKSLADLSVKYGAKKFVFVSTDKAVNPTNIMGASKRAAEMYIQALNAQSSTEFITTRFGNVLGSNGSVIPLFKKQIKKGGPITITHPEITRYFMTIPEACSLVLEAGAMGNGGEIFVFDMGKSVKIVDLAKKMVALAGLEIGKDIDLKVTGLRPGEKLYEELLSNKENTKPTHHPKIMIANVELNDFETVNYFFMAIRKSLLKSEEFEMIRKLKSLVPEFKSEVSRFKILDR
ncbi:MAG: FlaA1/EpsC-like NDP-sugar epimerase [Parvicella sp.]